LRKSNLRGFDIPGLEEKLIATLYADDTTVYLSEKDDFGVLSGILDRWCKASGAKFNTAKTEIVPLGTAEYRDQLIKERTSDDMPCPIPEGIKIARDGEAVRVLGAWPGNHVDATDIWSIRLDRLQTALDKWDRTSPTAVGKGIISRVIIGGHTQYLTAAQGMPADIEKRVEKMTMDFYWGAGKKHLINAEMLRE
ncbi:hypothetical protein AURDEDRAFT_30320, partial [Auricularia subglabra TFB-10046 SS5]